MEQDIKWHGIHAQKIHKREATHKQRLKRFKLLHSPKYRLNLKMPKILSLDKNYNETAEIFEKIHKIVFSDGRSVALDFSECEEVTPESCVVLAAEIDRCLRIKPKSITGNYPKAENVYFILQTLGFFRLLKIKADRNYTVPEVFIVPLVSGKEGKIELLNGMSELFVELPAYKELGMAFGGRVERVLTEAMTNTLEHAYPAEFKQKTDCVSRWWRAGFKTKQAITMVLYDQGAGIPNTLPAYWHETIKSFFKGNTSPSDGEMIKLAMKVRRSSTKQEQRGKGLPEIKNLIDIIGSGMLKVHSYRGIYLYRSEAGETHTSEEVPLHGTLIIWTANIKQGAI